MLSGGVSLRKRLRRWRRRSSRAVRRFIAAKLARLLSVLPASVPFTGRARRFVLEQAWADVPQKALDSYLVSGYHNPRINIQSILLRHALIRRLFGDEFEKLMEEEIRFALGLNEELRVRAIELGVPIGSFVNRERAEGVRRVDQVIAGRDAEFAGRWMEALHGVTAEPLSVLEFACGSANDYRAFVDYGIAPFLTYRGVDLTAANIANARERFPGIDFEVRSVLELPYEDRSFDCVIASALFEHLPIDDMQRALAEAGRLARSMLVLEFFSMADIKDHVVKPTGVYHWNLLSRSLALERIDARFDAITATPIAPWLRERYDYSYSFNPDAWTIIANA